jgi:N-alpha-acetyl-L-2,4-diaminobutyrate deacetylase
MVHRRGLCLARQALAECPFQAAQRLVNWQRAVKSKTELDYMRKAGRIVEAMHQRIVEKVEPGIRKSDLVAEIYDAGMSFPGRPDGSVTEKIADYFTRYLLPLADIVLDFHSGGRTLDFLPYAAAHALPDRNQEKACFDGVAAFSAPYSMRMIEIDAVGMYDTTAEEMGKVFVTTELSGGGTISARTASIAKRGVLNVLKHVGIVAGAPEVEATQWLDMPSSDCFVFAEAEGLFEPLKDLGDTIIQGEIIARIHPIGHTGSEPFDYRAALDGVLAARHFPGLIKTGDCLAVVATLTEAP